MLILGAVLLIAGYLLGISLLITAGVVLVIIGALLWVAGRSGHAIGGRRHYY